MIVYHGTTDRRARKICETGFLPRKPSRRVWFAESRGYALRRAKTQARRRHCRPVVLTCDINLSQLRERLGRKRVFQQNGVIAINERVPVSVLRSHPSLDQPSSPEELAAWVNHVLGLKSYKGVSRRHQGIERLSRWVVNRLSAHPRGEIHPGELVEMARQWLPEFFEGVEVDPEQLRVHRRPKMIEVNAEPEQVETDTAEDEALECLLDANPKRRVRGLALLAEIGEPELFDWCVMLLGDRITAVRVAALRTMRLCDEADSEVIAPLAASTDARVRAAAVAALAKISGKRAPEWFQRGLKDPSACVRVETASLLTELDPSEHRAIFELARHDPNPDIARRAKKLTAGKGFGRIA